jgi:hypothetical protein
MGNSIMEMKFKIKSKEVIERKKLIMEMEGEIELKKDELIMLLDIMKKEKKIGEE